MKNDLIERYIYAATKGLPREKREDVSLELHTLVEDMLAERCMDSVPTEKDIRVVLTELGTPQELFARYDEDADKCLIGQPYFSTYKFVLKIVLASVAVGVTIAVLIQQLLNPQDWLSMIIDGITDWTTMVYNSLLSSFAVVTLLFAFFQHKGVKLNESFDFDDLPPVPKKTQEISKWESIAGIGFCVVFMVLFVLSPQMLFSMRYDGMVIPIFEGETIRKTWFLIVGFGLCGIIREVVQLLEGRYNRKVLVTALITNGLSAVICTFWLMGHQLLNPAFVTNVEVLFAGEKAFIITLFSQFDLFFLGCMLFALVLDTVDVTVKTLRK